MAHTRVTRPLRNPARDTHFAGVPFMLVTERGRFPTWQPSPVTASRKVAGASFVKRQHMGFDLDRLETTVLLPDGDTGLRFMNAVNTTGELRIPAIAVMTTKYDTIWHNLNVDYVVYSDVHLDDVRDVDPLREGWVKATAVFTREHVVTP